MAEIETLARELGGKPPAAIAALSPADLNALAGAMRAARTRQKQQLDEALTRALEHVPALMRLPVRKVLGL